MQGIKKKLVAALTVVALVVSALATALPAYAEPGVTVATSTVTVSSTHADFAGQTVKIYKMFSAASNADGSAATYELETQWEGFFNSIGAVSSEEGATLSEKAFNYVSGLEGDELAAFANSAREWADDSGHSIPATDTQVASSETPYTATFSKVAYGYYLVDPGDAPEDSEEHSSINLNAILVNVLKDAVEVNLKSEYPTVDKTVENGQNHASAQVGDKLNFKLEATIPDVTNYEKYIFNLQDTLSDGLTLDQDSVKVQVGGTDADAGNYAVKFGAGTAGDPSMTVHFGTSSDGGTTYDAKAYFTGKAGQKITVTYTATVNENAIVNADDELNSAKVEYSTSPDGESTGESEDDKTHQYTFGFDLTKVDGADDETVLPGATFQLKTADGSEVIKLVKTASGAYRPATGAEAAVSDDGKTWVEEVTTGDDGKLVFVGLAEGEYQLVETKAPDGYNELGAPKYIKIAATYNTDGTLQYWTVSIFDQTGQELTPSQDNNGQDSITVENNKGTLLPGTGGMGTVIFTVVGVAVVAGGAIWMVQRNRRNAASSGSHMA
ncbi:SpaH/EbpB family LPXTG-anchored major pilin [Collinsella tanakaei]|uniref:SpaH/EbpB family LPXTG-anchored major pilin n=1 Tax=Collinsella tanakaei TaxID=626935 RepID=UPI00195A1771|nr:SpaH/EbpB family LPXTG-anchored major pilin [Collinsella tanakaei]MBM6756042.1 SpaH/EbpB family LPXTG-anchored major pilin [Collinsella tanakaei]